MKFLPGIHRLNPIMQASCLTDVDRSLEQFFLTRYTNLVVESEQCASPGVRQQSNCVKNSQKNDPFLSKIGIERLHANKYILFYGLTLKMIVLKIFI